MGKLIGNGNISGYVPKMIELRYGYIINGQYYTGEEMQAAPFCTAYHTYLTNLSNAQMFLKSSIGIGSKSYAVECNNNLFFDKFDSEVSYLYCSTNNHTYYLIMKFREKNGECTIEAIDFQAVYTTSVSDTLVDIQQREADKIVFIFNEKHISSTCRLIGIVFNTADLSLYKKTYNNTNSYHFTASKIDENLYFVSGYTNSGVMRLTSTYDQEYKGFTVGSTHGNYAYDIAILNSIKTESDSTIEHKVYYYLYPNSSAHTIYNKHILATITINKQTNEMSITTKDVTTDTTVPVCIKLSGFHYSYVINGTSKKYLVDFISNVTPGTCIFTLYEILADGNLKVLKSKDIAQNVALNLLFKNDGKRVLVPSMTSAVYTGTITRIAIFDWNEAQEDFIVTKTIDDSIHAFGYNKNDELFVMKKDTSIDKYNDTSVAAFNAKFAEPYYKYQGENIPTHLTCNITNLEGEQLAKKVMLELEGAAYFTDNSTKKIEFTTSTSEMTTVNITISGPGAVNIYPKIEA